MGGVTRSGLWAWLIPLTLIQLALIALPPSSVSAFSRSETLTSLPQISTAQAIAYLSAARAANGIPGDLVDNPTLDQGCAEYTNLYKPLKGQYPHEEVAGQPGYTALGNEAAASSDLGSKVGGWTEKVDPWWEAPLHLASLFNPAGTTTWYGETKERWGLGGVCMGVGRDARPFAGPAFYSLPGDRATDVDPWETVGGEQPFSPGETVGLPQGTKTGRYIFLWAEGTDALLESASLAGPRGTAVPIKLVKPDTPAPSPPSWPQVTTVRGYSGVTNYVIPVHALTPSASYVLTANWRDSAGAKHAQTVHFKTVSAAQQDRDERVPDFCPDTSCAHGYLKFATTARRIILTGEPAVGQPLHVVVNRGIVQCVVPTSPCPVSATRHLWDASMKRTVKLGSSTVSLPLPKRGPKDRVIDVYVTLGRFTTLGHQWVPSTLWGSAAG